MIIKGEARNSSFSRFAIILLFSIGGAWGLWYLLPYLSSWKKDGVIYCDAETIRGSRFISQGDVFYNGKSQNSEQAFEGTYSSKIERGEGFQYGFGYDFENFESGKTYVASVWRKGENSDGSGALVIMDKNKFLDFEITDSERHKNGWDYLEKKFTIPFQTEIEALKIYVRTDGKGVFYFDNLKIVETDQRSKEQGTPNFIADILDLKISDKGIKSLLI